MSKFIFLYVLLHTVLTVYIAEDLNEYLANHHKVFTRHQYFDSSGLFISLFMSTPLLLASAFIVVSFRKKVITKKFGGTICPPLGLQGQKVFFKIVIKLGV